MSNPMERRIARLEALSPPKPTTIAIFVDDEDDVPRKVEEMIAAGQIAEADRHRCVFWLDQKHYQEWRREAKDEKLLAADAARQKAKAEQAERDKAERDRTEQEKTEHKTVGQENAEREDTEQDEVEPQTVEQQNPDPHKADQQEAPPQTTDEQIPARQTIDGGTVPPGCL
jgi:hypothetical protein